MSGRARRLVVLDVLSVSSHAGERQAHPGRGAWKHGDVRQVASRQACSVLSNRIGGPASAHDPRSYCVGDMVGDWWTQCHWTDLVPVLYSCRQGGFQVKR